MVSVFAKVLWPAMNHIDASSHFFFSPRDNPRISQVNIPGFEFINRYGGIPVIALLS